MLLDASPATVRRDIAALDAAGAARRVRGGIEAVGRADRTHLVGMPFLQRQAVAGATKRAIARAAASLLSSSDSLVISGGSTTAHLVEFLVGGTRDVLTNSMPVAIGLAGTRNRVTVPGGTIYPDQNIVLSPFADDISAHFRGDVCLAGCHGLDRSGVMEADPLIVQGQLRLLAAAERLIVLADSRKLLQRSAMLVAALARVSCLVTDTAAEERALEPLRAAGVRIMLVETPP